MMPGDGAWVVWCIARMVFGKTGASEWYLGSVVYGEYVVWGV